MECLIRITVAAAPLCICVSFCICRHVHLLVYCTILRTAYPSDPEIAFSDPMGANTSSTCYLYTNVSLYVSLSSAQPSPREAAAVSSLSNQPGFRHLHLLQVRVSTFFNANYISLIQLLEIFYGVISDIVTIYTALNHQN